VTGATWKERPGAPNGDRDPPSGLTNDTEHLWVSEVEAGGAAAEAGLLIGDRIVAVDGVDVATVGVDLVRQMLAPIRTRAGDSRSLSIDRDGKRSTITIKARAPAPAK
jgi:C-terminal processing protease CtpA/Prc